MKRLPVPRFLWTRRSILLIAALMIVVVFLLSLDLRKQRLVPLPPHPIQSIAVLPLANLAGEPQSTMWLLRIFLATSSKRKISVSRAAS